MEPAVGAWICHMKLCRAGITAAALPGAILLLLFYTLALHMYWQLGGWPRAIGMNGFPPSLLVHCALTQIYFAILFYSLAFGLPGLFFVSLMTRTWRALMYMAVLVVFCVATYGLMQLAPAGFLRWWLD
jgi:hypothetical protein